MSSLTKYFSQTALLQPPYVNPGVKVGERIDLQVCRLALGKDHPATKMAEKGIALYFPKVAHLLPDDHSNRMKRGLSEIELMDSKTPDYIR